MTRPSLHAFLGVLALCVAGIAPAWAGWQSIVPTPASLVVEPGASVTLGLTYQTDPCAPNLTGLGLRLHWDSTRLSLLRIDNLFQYASLGVGDAESDADNLDGEATTDTRLAMGWADIAGAWPGGDCAPITLLTAWFQVAADFAGATKVAFSASSTAAGQALKSTPAWLTLTERPDRSGFDWQVAEIYLATMGYAPDAEGLNYWVGMLETDPAWVPVTVAQSFFDQELVQVKYPETLDNASFIDALYRNIFNRAPDSAGQSYWLAELESGSVLRNEMIIALIEGGWANPEAAADMARFGNLVTVSLAFAEYQSANGIVYSQLSAEQQASLRAAGATVVAGVTADPATVEAALASIPTLLGELTPTAP